MFYQNAYPVTAVAYGLYPIRDPDPANLAPLRGDDVNCVAQRVMEHFEGALRGQGHDGRTYRGGRREFTKVVQLLTTWLNWKRSSSGRSSYGTLPVRTSTTVEGMVGAEMVATGPPSSLYHNGHAWFKDLYFPQSREYHFYEGDVWLAIREATFGEPLAV